LFCLGVGGSSKKSNCFDCCVSWTRSISLTPNPSTNPSTKPKPQRVLIAARRRARRGHDDGALGQLRCGCTLCLWANAPLRARPVCMPLPCCQPNTTISSPTPHHKHYKTKRSDRGAAAVRRGARRRRGFIGGVGGRPRVRGPVRFWFVCFCFFCFVLTPLRVVSAVTRTANTTKPNPNQNNHDHNHQRAGRDAQAFSGPRAHLQVCAGRHGARAFGRVGTGGWLFAWCAIIPPILTP
jgi:hypothetical protein